LREWLGIDGKQHVIRETTTTTTTTLYETAWQYKQIVTTGNSKCGLARYFSFGKAPQAYAKPMLTKEFAVEVAG